MKSFIPTPYKWKLPWFIWMSLWAPAALCFFFVSHTFQYVTFCMSPWEVIFRLWWLNHSDHEHPTYHCGRVVLWSFSRKKSCIWHATRVWRVPLFGQKNVWEQTQRHTVEKANFTRLIAQVEICPFYSQFAMAFLKLKWTPAIKTIYFWTFLLYFCCGRISTLFRILLQLYVHLVTSHKSQLGLKPPTGTFQLFLRIFHYRKC